ncbi:hypothetical protein PVS_50 [Vibrio phage vB_VspS_VS-ABTNL-3]|nr:hypothetical protein PVS_50 [Vibrio phage vB_VspS_VS-ABTNL-3]
MARKGFNFIVTSGLVTVQRLAYADADSPAEVVDTLEFSVEDVPAELQNGEAVTSLAAYGLSQVLQDRCSSVQADEKFAQMQKTFESLQEGKWKETRVSTGGAKKASIDPFFAAGFAAFCVENGKDVDANTATILLQGMDADKRKALRQHDDIKSHIEAAKAAAAAKVEDFDVDSLFN